jgi:hypothetical protein
MPYCTKCGRYVFSEGGRCFRFPLCGLLGGLFVLALVVLGVPVCCCAGLMKNFEPKPPLPPPSTNDRVFVNKASIGKVLDAPDKPKRQLCSVSLWHPLNDCQDQRWYLRDVPGDGKFVIIHDRFTNFVLDANLQQVRNNDCPVALAGFNNGTNQQWKIDPVGDYVKIINRASGKVLTADSKKVFENRCPIVLWEDNNSDEGLWKIQ